MRVEEVDERDIEWESNTPRFRVHIFTPKPPQVAGFPTAPDIDVLEISNASITEVLEWLEERLNTDQVLALGVVSDTSPSGEPRKGVTWLRGAELVSSYS